MKRVALIAPNYPAGKDAAAGFKRFYKGDIAIEMFPKLGQLDFAAEIAQVRAANVDGIYYFLPGGMGVNFSKQYSTRPAWIRRSSACSRPTTPTSRC
jgi:branched-chain amino acid transport system substrate-binding protein